MGDITGLLHQWRAGDRDAEDQLFALVFPKLRGLAHHMMMRERKGHTLQATELVDQIYLKLVAAKDRDWQNRQHFFAITARAMRRHLIDHARGRPAAAIVGLEEMKEFLPAGPANLDLALSVGRLLDQLAEFRPELSMAVEMKFFLGLTDEEAAETLGLKLRSFQRMWHDARRWLYEQLESEGRHHAADRQADQHVPRGAGR